MAERGIAAVEFALGFLVLVVPAALLVLSFGPSLEGRLAARALAVEVARAVVVDGPTTDAVSGSAVGENVAVAVCDGRESADCAPDEVVVRVVVQVPGGPFSAAPMRVTAEHREPIDPFASRK